MSGPDADADRGRWPVWRLAVLFYPFAAAAVAINLFMLALIGTWIGLPSLAPGTALELAFALGLPATWAAGSWVRGLMDSAAAP